LGSLVGANLFHKSGHKLPDYSLHFSLVSHAFSVPRTASHRGRWSLFLWRASDFPDALTQWV